MYAEIATALASIKSASDLASLILKSKVDSAVTQKAIELNSDLIALQSAILSIQVQNQELLAENNHLKQELIDVQNWEAEASKYDLIEINPGVFVYTIKADQQGAEPAPWLCANCYQKRQKSILQRTPMGLRPTFGCPNCKTHVTIHQPSR